MNNTLNSLNELASCTFPPIVKVEELTVGAKYKILQIKKISTRFGPCVVCRLEGKGDIFLPRRLEKDLNDDIITYLLAGQGSHLMYQGKKVISSKLPANIFEFEKIDYDETLQEQ
ncbi:hypothetical protein Zmor_015021 [Zophobas morio]|uniref:Uncharacterized protein n=1 Tax=Zophobas morio TaxID=2755281 RepID=A0AA38MHI3_9CUCU|nr:hypothetical protein Zmor_015021 [Zophobas morio]